MSTGKEETNGLHDSRTLHMSASQTHSESSKPSESQGSKDEAGDEKSGSEHRRNMTGCDEEEVVQALSKHERGWRRIVRNFSPSWFSMTMGTGAVAILLITIPYQARWLYYLSIVFFSLNTILFILAAITSILRYTLYPEIWFVMLKDPFNSLFLATIPIGFATLVKLWVSICVPAWGEWALTVAWIGWMIDSVAAASITVFMSFRLMSPDSFLSSLSGITAVQLLPIAATVTASVLGGVIAEILPNHQHALGTLITSYTLWGMSMPLALTVIVMYYQRLAVHKIPSREVIVSCFLPLGPLGYGGFGVALTLIPLTSAIPAIQPELSGSILYVIGLLTALILWSFGVVFMVLAVASIHKSRPFPFNMGWWGFTFPLAVFSLSTMQIGQELESVVFRVLGTMFATAVILLWIVVAAGTVRGAWSGKLFYAPCLANLKKKKEEEDQIEEDQRKLDEDIEKRIELSARG